MNSQSLKAQKRSVLGRKVKNLRKDGILPANIYGKKIKSQSVQVNLKDFTGVFEKVGETGLVDLELENKKLPVLIHNISYHPVSHQTLHADFYQVDLKEKVTTDVPLEIIGESIAVNDKLGVLLTILSEVEVESLPADLPEKIQVDVSNLKAVDESIKISDLKTSDKVKILTDLNLEIVKIAPLVSKEAEEMVKEQEAAAAVAEVEEEKVTETEVSKEARTVDQPEDKVEKPEDQPKPQ